MIDVFWPLHADEDFNAVRSGECVDYQGVMALGSLLNVRLAQAAVKLKRLQARGYGLLLKRSFLLIARNPLRTTKEEVLEDLRACEIPTEECVISKSEDK